MPRSKKPIPKRIIKPDPVYNNLLVARFISRIMRDGKKTVAEKIVYGALDLIDETYAGKDPIDVFTQAIGNTIPKMEVRPRRIGGASYQVPMEVRGSRREALAVRWLIDAAKNRPVKEFTNKKLKYPLMAAKLAAELIDASQGGGEAVTRKEEIHRVAEANKAFAHFRW